MIKPPMTYIHIQKNYTRMRDYQIDRLHCSWQGGLFSGRALTNSLPGMPEHYVLHATYVNFLLLGDVSDGFFARQLPSINNSTVATICLHGTTSSLLGRLLMTFDSCLFEDNLRVAVSGEMERGVLLH